MPQPYTLIGLDIEGEWNQPLLVNAAAVSDCRCVFAGSPPPAGEAASPAIPGGLAFEQALEGCRHVIACETGRRSVGLYDFPAPRERTAVIVGNEERGIPARVLKRADAVVSIPMAQGSLSSINVAAAAAITLYALTRDLGRKRRRTSALKQSEVDLLIRAPDDPHELGSLLRSAFAFGWRRVFVQDPHRVWFTDDAETVLASRAAARRAKNLLAVLPAETLHPQLYDTAIVCEGETDGAPVSKLRLPDCRRLLVVYGAGGPSIIDEIPSLPVAVDYANRSVPARYRHSGSILFSMVSQLLRS
jgi:hypothetical protein